MRKIILTAVFFIGCAISSIAQESSKLTIPSGPAFSIVDMEPTAVMRPTNARAVATDLLNKLDKEGRMNLNVALEVTPYWLTSRPKLDRQKYLHPDIKQAFLQSLSFSGAAVRDTANSATKIGTGFRFKLLNGRAVDELAAADEELRKAASIIGIITGVRTFVADTSTKAGTINVLMSNLQTAGISAATVEKVKKDALVLASRFADSKQDIRQMLDDLRDMRADANKDLAQKVSDLTYERRGWFVEFAGAAAYNSAAKKNLERTGVWGNLSYFMSPDDQFTLTARYMSRRSDTSLDNFDVGMSFLKKMPSFNISVEGMLRSYNAKIPGVNDAGVAYLKAKKATTYRLAVQSSYNLNENLSVNFSFGKDFNSPTITTKGFFSILGLSFAVFDKEIGKLPKQEQ